MGWIELYLGDVDMLVSFKDFDAISVFSHLSRQRLKDLEPEHAGKIQRIQNQNMTIVESEDYVAIVIRTVIQSCDLQVKLVIWLL